jgi:hypothetical protein
LPSSKALREESVEEDIGRRWREGRVKERGEMGAVDPGRTPAAMRVALQRPRRRESGAYLRC